MHPDIKRVIDQGIRNIDNQTVLLTLSSPQHTSLGRLLYTLYYLTDVMSLIDHSRRFGYPHNGGEHTFSYRGPHQEALTVLELFQEVLSKFPLSDDERAVCHQLSYISQEVLTWRGIGLMKDKRPGF